MSFDFMSKISHTPRQTTHTQTHPRQTLRNAPKRNCQRRQFFSQSKNLTQKKVKLARSRCKFHGAARKNGPFRCKESVLNAERKCSKFAKVSVRARGVIRFVSGKPEVSSSVAVAEGPLTTLPLSPRRKRNPLAMAMSSWMIRHRSQRQRSN